MNNRKAVRILIAICLLNLTLPPLLIYLISTGRGPTEVEYTVMYIAPYTIINALVLLYAMKNRPKKKKKSVKKV